MTRHLVLHDVDAIQRYIFSTGRLREVRGASALIDQINRQDTQRLIHHYRGRRIYAGGGSVAADFSTYERARDFCSHVSKTYVEKTFTSSSTGVIQPYDETVSTASSNSFHSALQRAHINLRYTKESRDQLTQMLASPYFKLCQSCGTFPAAYEDNLSGTESGLICHSCHAKRKMPRHPFIQRYITRQAHHQHDVSLRWPALLDDIGQASDPQGYIGVIYSDGNRMGDRLQQLETREELRQFSVTVDQALKEAITTILLQQYVAGKTGEQFLPAAVPLCGGDDLVVIVPGHQALALAVAYLKSFQCQVRDILPEGLAKRIQTTELSACAGIAIAPSNTPLISLLDLAHELCQSAKARSYEYAMAPSPQEMACLDFQVVTTPSWQRLQDVRNTTYMLEQRTRLTARPYTCEEATNLIQAVKRLKREQFPPGKLHDFYRSLWQGRYQATLRYLHLVTRAQEQSHGRQQKTALHEIAQCLGVNPIPRQDVPLPPWQPWTGQGHNANWLQTPYGDLVEIYAYVEG